jgi:PAS domain S-box-containing protein/putative nucleotidyltransferase with HDIG domain
VIAFAAALFALILGLHFVVGAEAVDATLILFVVPISLCAIEFGMRGGLAASLVSVALLVGWDLRDQGELGALGFATLTTAYLLVGGLLGRFVDHTRELERWVERHFELSLDLFCTADFNGYFEQVNPAWEAALGYTSEELRSRPFVEFVHPDDRERTEAETAKLAETTEDSISFRNRYRRADGVYRWLEWNATSVAKEGRIYATARDITPQQQAERALENQNDLLDRSVRERTGALEEARLEILQRLALAAEYRDDDTHQHTERVGRAAALIAQQLGISQESVAVIRRAAPLHDIGKVGIPDTILLKPGKLSPEEYHLMQEHTEIGAKILTDGKFAVLRLAREIALSHHERWAGGGYPNDLRGDSIPLAGRITAVADVFDALTHERPYKAAWPVDEALTEIEGLAGEHFDPAVVRAFSALPHERLLLSVDEYDLDLPPPPLTTPAHGNGSKSGSEHLVGAPR